MSKYCDICCYTGRTICRTILLDDITLALQYLLQACVAVVACYVAFSFLKPDREKPINYKVDLPDALKPGWDGEIIEPQIRVSGSTAIQCYCPANGKLLGRINPTTPDGIDRAIEKASNAQKQWCKTTFAQRRQVLKTLLKYILSHQDDIVKAACLDSGKTRVDASFGEVLVTAEKLSFTIKHGEKFLKPESRLTNLLMCYKKNEVRWEPLGVVSACVSWNYPFHNLLNGIISAIFAGNAIVVKASEQTAWSAQYFTEIVRGALRACGHQGALVQSVICWPAVAPHLTSHPGLSHITFIGSQAIAYSVAHEAAKSLTSLCLELGGKDAAIVLDDVVDPVLDDLKKLEKIASFLMRGVFQAAGQNCIGIERVVAMPKAYERIKSLILPRVKALRIGSALDEEEEVDMGACISSNNFDRLENLIQDAVNRGAELLCGGKRYEHPKWPKGHYFLPTMLAGVTREMPIAQQELFAPVFVLMRAESVEDTIEITNSTPFGLGCSVFGTNKKDLEKVTSEVQVGNVSVNDFACYYVCSLPFGGVKTSGYGRFGGAEGLRGLCNSKSVCTDRFPRLLSTSIPPRLDYAKSATTRATGQAKKKAWEFVKGVVETGYGIGVSGKAEGIRKIIFNS